ncbi:MAG: hypothetical protein QG673_519 [Pseudomonadota bacterium]|nr:hypothetical protein [Pseudomonadota bacterium]
MLPMSLIVSLNLHFVYLDFLLWRIEESCKKDKKEVENSC